MADFYEIDFLDVESNKSGDAICMRYSIGGITTIHVTDGGFQTTGEKIVEHLSKYYDNPPIIHHVVVSHNDGDHAGGIKYLVENYPIENIWMLCPWEYATELLPRFSRYTNADNLARKLREVYGNLSDIEQMARQKGITIKTPFRGAQIGHFYTMSPTKEMFLDLIVESDKTPQAATMAQSSLSIGILQKAFSEAVRIVRAMWGQEDFPSDDTSAENEMSVVQYGSLCGDKILLTADTGRRGLQSVIDFAPLVGLNLPGIKRFQVPHHGSRRNVSTSLLDQILGPRLPDKPDESKTTFSGIVSSAKADEDHPRKAVVRAIIHRGGKLFTTEGNSIRFYSSSAPPRAGWSAAKPADYPHEQEG